MQVEYESSPAGAPSSTIYQQDESMIEEGESFRPGQSLHQNGNESDGENHDQNDLQEDGAGVGEESIVEKPIKKITKQRQSLAEKQLGTTIFPLSRVKKIIKADKELDNMSSEAVFTIAVATEYFIKHFMEEGYTKARLEKRKTVNYKDMAAVVARSEEFDFLKDVIPQPISLSEALERRKQKASTDDNPSLHDNDQNTTSLNDEDLPPLAISTNPLFPNAIMKKPPNTHAKTAIPKPQPIPHTENEDENQVQPLPQPQNQSPIKPITTLPTSEKPPKSTRRQSNTQNSKNDVNVNSSPKIFTGKNAPSTPHGLTTRGAARRSLVGNEVDMSPSNEIRKEITPEDVIEGEGNGNGEGGEVDERMEE